MFVIFSKQVLAIGLLCMMFSVVISKPKKKQKKPTCSERVNNAKMMIRNLPVLEEECNATFNLNKIPPPVNVNAVWTTYVRWGRTVCPDTAELFYEGIAGGSSHSHSGSGANYVCLPKKPEWGKIIAGLGGSGAYMYGAEYELTSGHSNPFLATNAPNTGNADSLHDNDVPCVVCQIPRGVSMVPARHSCPTGWTLEYKGYLVADHHTHPRSAVFECMDEAPETTQGGHASQNGALFYSVQAVCGSLPCPDYIQGGELTCAVCSK
ncbi:unnamed protein product [Owenia fusiformis]|uniref:Uncharacterized protein n=1 Tax=Owenia fusiformis TaxID=6347 RepID=A0A8J1TCF3_OWEFU|nr:unnamed protein product [Owenia fusiformis]